MHCAAATETLLSRTAAAPGSRPCLPKAEAAPSKNSRRSYATVQARVHKLGAPAVAAALLALPPVRVLTRVAGAAWDRLRGVQALARLAKGSSAELHFERDALHEAGCLLPYDLRVELLPHLPYALRQRAWRLLFSTSEDGCSLRTMYLRLQDQGPVLLLVQARSQSAVDLASPSPRPHLAPISRCRLSGDRTGTSESAAALSRARAGRRTPRSIRAPVRASPSTPIGFPVHRPEKHHTPHP